MTGGEKGRNLGASLQQKGTTSSPAAGGLLRLETLTSYWENKLIIQELNSIHSSLIVNIVFSGRRSLIQEALIRL